MMTTKHATATALFNTDLSNAVPRSAPALLKSIAGMMRNAANSETVARAQSEPDTTILFYHDAGTTISQRPAHQTGRFMGVQQWRDKSGNIVGIKAISGLVRNDLYRTRAIYACPAGESLPDLVALLDQTMQAIKPNTAPAGNVPTMLSPMPCPVEAHKQLPALADMPIHGDRISTTRAKMETRHGVYLLIGITDDPSVVHVIAASHNKLKLENGRAHYLVLYSADFDLHFTADQIMSRSAARTAHSLDIKTNEGPFNQTMWID